MSSANPRRRGALGLLVAPLAWALHHQLGSNASFAACEHAPDLLALWIGAGMLVVILASAVLAWREWRRAGGTWAGHAERIALFVPLLSIMACGAFGMPVLAQLMANFVVPTCHG